MVTLFQDFDIFHNQLSLSHPLHLFLFKHIVIKVTISNFSHNIVEEFYW